jgi:hypothetical protein
VTGIRGSGLAARGSAQSVGIWGAPLWARRNRSGPGARRSGLGAIGRDPWLAARDSAQSVEIRDSPLGIRCKRVGIRDSPLGIRRNETCEPMNPLNPLNP